MEQGASALWKEGKGGKIGAMPPPVYQRGRGGMVAKKRGVSWGGGG
jgi:hypothetical protein